MKEVLVSGLAPAATAGLNFVNSMLLVSGLTNVPGLMMFTIASPSVTAITVVMRYQPNVFPPILERLDISFKSVMPFTREVTISGIANSLRRLRKMLPIGFIQLVANALPPGIFLNNIPMSTPANRPMITTQWNAIFIRARLNVKQILVQILFRGSAGYFLRASFYFLWFYLSSLVTTITFLILSQRTNYLRPLFYF